MNHYQEYIKEIEERKAQGLHPKPIDSAELVNDLIAQIKDTSNAYREDSLKFFIYNTLPGTTPAAGAKAHFLKQIILGDENVAEITPTFALELLSHMKGGPSIAVLLDLALGENAEVAKNAAEVLKTQVYLYDADADRLKVAYEAGNAVAKDILESYAKAEFFTKLPDVPEEIKIVTYIAGEGEITNLKAQHPDKSVMLIAEKGTMGVGSSRMSGVNNVALWTGKQASPYVPFVNFAPIVGGTNGISPIFLTTVDVTGGIGIDLKNWVKKTDAEGNLVRDENGEPVLEQAYSVATGTVLTINTKTKKLYNGAQELIDISKALTPQKMEFIKAGGSYAIVFGKKIQTFAAKTLGITAPVVFAPSKEISNDGQGLTAVEKILNRNAVGNTPGKVLHAGSDVRVTVNIVGSQDTTGLMTAQELESMAATVISP